MGLFERDIRDNIAAAGALPMPQTADTRPERLTAQVRLDGDKQAGSGVMPHTQGLRHSTDDGFGDAYTVYDSAGQILPEQPVHQPAEPVTAETVLRELAKELRRTDRLLVTG